MWTKMIYKIAELAESSFAILEALGNLANVAIIIIGVVMMVWWIGQMFKYDREAERNGTLK